MFSSLVYFPPANFYLLAFTCYTISKMNEILHANIFFFIASIAVVCFSILIGIALYYVIKIMKLIRSILERVEAGSEVLAEDAARIRAMIAEGGIISKIFGFIVGQAMGGGATRRKRKTSTKDINNED